MGVYDLLNWFAGGSERYMTLVHCMNHDTFWIALTVLLDLLVASGYVLIALHWRKNERPLQASPAKAALGMMKNIFILCGLCGYVFIPIKMVWPAWRLYDGFLAVLAYYTWRYALRAGDLTVIYSELSRSEQLARDLEESREESRRKSFFLNAISHDLKTPLNGLMLQAELAELNLETHDTEMLRESLQDIKSCARTTADLLNSFMEIGRIDWSDGSTDPCPLDLLEVTQSVVGRHRARAGHKGLGLTCHVPAGMIITTDRVKLERIVSNLVDNAIKFTKSGTVGLSVEARGADVTIVVADTGEGIAPEHQAAIFGDFFQAQNSERDSRKGFGLGLAIARRLASQLGGDLTVESAVGRGSRFTLLLRGVLDASRPSTPAGGSSASTTRGRIARALG